MKSIDVHAHINPRPWYEAVQGGRSWHTLGSDQGELENPANHWSLEERVADMDRLGIDMQLLTPYASYFKYGLDLEWTRAIARDTNDDLAAICREYPDRFTALGTVPMQDSTAAVAELERAAGDLGLKGVVICDHINGQSLDQPEFRPFWKAAAELNAVVQFHQSMGTVVESRLDRYFLTNTIGNLVDRAITFGVLVHGGVMDEFPDLKVCFCHGGGYTAFAVARMDLGWHAEREIDYMVDYSAGENASQFIDRPPSEYLGRFYYDCLTASEETLRFLIDTVGIDRVVFGTDYPAPMQIQDSVNWLNGLTTLTAEEKNAILRINPNRMIGTA